MAIAQLIESVFSDIGIPGFFQVWRPTDEYPEMPDTYGVWLIQRESEALAADDGEAIREIDVTVHLVSKDDLTDICERVRASALRRNIAVLQVRNLDDVRNGDYQYHVRFDLVAYQFNI